MVLGYQRGCDPYLLGDLMETYPGHLKGSTNNQVECMALFWGLKLALSIGIRALIIEGDLKLVIDATQGQANINWSSIGMVNDIKRLLLGLDYFSICHTFREGNVVIDTLTTLDLQLADLRCWRDLRALPPNVKFLLERERK
ncbi:hypothetical protein SUGI_0120060 [Cryptomeria japonica]|nr:hypothetical protein SUGI_0120060 [Cryptomeria japonica]